MNLPFRSAGWVIFVATFVSAPSGTAIQAQDFKPPIAKMELKNGDAVVFLGDSITHQCLYTQYVEDYYYTRYPQMRINFHNAGVGGRRALDAIARFNRDVAAYKPKYVTVLLGMNDGTYIPYDENTFQTYRNGMKEVVAQILEAGAMPVLMTPTMYDSRAARMRDPKTPPARLELYNSTLAYYGAWLRETAVEAGHGFVDMYSPLNNLTLAARKTDPRFTLIKDAVHPDAPGQLVMAFALLHDLGAAETVSKIEITKDTDGNFIAKTAGGKVGQLNSTKEGHEFSWQAESLPWVVPPDAEVGVKLLYAGHRLGRETIAVESLAPGRYDLAVDDQVVGTFTADQFAGGVELQDNPKTPQYQQALEVAVLNKKRNEGPVRALRGEWSKMQLFYRLQTQVAADKGNADIVSKLDAQRKIVDGLEDRIAMHEQAAKEIEDQIFQVNQPKARKYRVTKSQTAAGQ